MSTSSPRNHGLAAKRTEAALKLYRAGQLAEAADHCRIALELDPDQEVALQILGAAHAAAGQLDSALSCMRRAVAVVPDNERNHNNLGVLLARLKRHAEAIVSYDRALAIRPDFAEALHNRGNALLALGRSQEAIACYDRALASKPDYAEAHSQRAAVGQALARAAEAAHQCGTPRLADLEAAVYRRAPDALLLLFPILYALAADKLPITDLVQDGSAPAAATVATRLANAIGTLMADPGVELGAEDVQKLATLAQTVHHVFAASALETTDHCVAALGAHDTASLQALWHADRQRFLKAALMLSIDSRLPIDVAALFGIDPDLTVLLYLNLLSAKPVATSAGQMRRDRLLELAPGLPLALPGRDTNQLTMLANAWMNCSYAARSDKHQVKKRLNRILRDRLRACGLHDAELPGRRQLSDRPILLVAAEVMRSDHVQYRYFGQYLRQLRSRFRLVLLTEGAGLDAHVRALYDEVVAFERGNDIGYLRGIADAIGKIGPDLIFWLSVGMRHWGPALANFRLAPIQIAGLGHSASTFCETIDYYLTEEGFVSDPALLSEKPVLLPDRSLIFERLPQYRPVPVQIREIARPLRAAVACNLLKLNPQFIATLRRIGEAASRPIEFHLFPNVAGVLQLAAAQLIGRSLPDATIHPALAADRYLGQLSECDLSLSPFPFGGMHSVVDALRQGLPVVAMEGTDLHGRTDAMLLRRLGMPEWLICRDDESYIRAAGAIIEDDALRVGLSRQAVGLAIDRTLFGDATTPLRTEVVAAVWWVYRNHERIQTSGQKVFGVQDWTAAIDG